MRELVAILLNLLVGRFRRVIAGSDVLPEKNLHRAFRSHNRNLGRRPRDVEVAPNVLRAHNVVCSTVRLAGYHGELRDGGFAVCVKRSEERRVGKEWRSGWSAYH